MKVRIKDYQTIADTTFEIKGFTVVVGKSNTGKTAMLRAIEGSMFNDPVTGKVRHGKKDTSVEVEYKDIAWKWSKGGTYNDYDVITPTKSEKYSRVGFKVPSEIVDAGFKEWWVDNMKARPQIAAWHEPIFLLNKTGKVITELIATVTRLDVVNLAIRNGSRVLRKKRSRLKVREEDLLKAERRAREFDVLDDIDVQGLDSACASFGDTQKGIDAVGEFIIRYENLYDRLTELAPVDDVVVPTAMPTAKVHEVAKLQNWEGKHDTLEATLGGLASLDDIDVPHQALTTCIGTLEQVKGLRAYEVNLTSAQGALTALNGLPDVVIPEVDLQDMVDSLAQVNDFITRLLKVGGDLKQAKTDLNALDGTIETDEQHLEALRGSIDVCPVCARS